MKRPSSQRSNAPELKPLSHIQEEDMMLSDISEFPNIDTDLSSLSGEIVGSPSQRIRGDVGHFVESFVNHEAGGRVSFEMRPWLPRIYESEHIASRVDGKSLRPKRRTILKTARQCEKSTTLGNKIATYSALLHNCTSLYVSSSEKQSQEFASERLQNVLRVSPGLRGSLGSELEGNKFTKRWSNSSRVLIRSVNYDRPPMAVRGIPADVVVIDEIQDVNPQHIPIITSCTNNSSLAGGPIWMLAGTALTSDNFISQTFHKESTQNYWLTRCGACRHWTPPFQASVSRKGMICEKCGNAINPLRGQWVSYRTRGLEDLQFEGYHMSRVMMPYTRLADISAFEDSWESFYSDFTNTTFTEGKIANELFGLEYDSGRKPVTREELLDLCNSAHSFRRVVPDRVLADPDWPVFMGVDWGEGSGDGSYTVVTIGIPIIEEGGSGNTKILVTYMKRYEGAESDPTYVKEDLVELFISNRVNLAFVDAGHGWGMLDHLWEVVPDGRKKIFPMRYRPSGAILSYSDNDGVMSAHRTRWMARVFSMLKRRMLVLPRWEDFGEPFADDILSIFVDRSSNLRQSEYRHSGTDDSFHSILYMMTALLYYRGELDEFLNA